MPKKLIAHTVLLLKGTEKHSGPVQTSGCLEREPLSGGWASTAGPRGATRVRGGRGVASPLLTSLQTRRHLRMDIPIILGSYHHSPFLCALK